MKKILLCFLVGVWGVNSAFASDGKPDSLQVNDNVPENAEVVVLKNSNNGMHQAFESSEKTTKKKIGPMVRVSGFMRVVGFYRNMDSYYSDMDTDRGLTVPVTVNIGEGAGSPIVMMRLETNPTSKSSILLESSLHSPFLSNAEDVYGTQSKASNPAYPGNIASIFSRFALNATTVTDFATIHIQAGGGANFGKISPFTLWTFQYRDDMFERYPWDPAGSNWNRYNFNYSLGDIPRDLRWGRRPVQGFKFAVEDLPHGFEGMFFYGKTSPAGSWESYKSQLPQNVLAFRVAKKIKGHKVGINYYNHFGYSSSTVKVDTVYSSDGTKNYLVESNRSNQGTATVDGLFNVPGKLRIYTEVGVGWFKSNRYNDGLANNAKETSTGELNRYKRRLSPLAYLEVDWKNAPWFTSFTASGFYAGRNAINNASSLINSSNEGATDGRDFQDLGAGNDNVFYLEGMVTEIGQITNNRTGASVKLRKNIKGLVIDLGLGAQTEIEKVYQDTTVNGGRLNTTTAEDLQGGHASNGVRNSVTLYHVANQYQRSRFKYNKRGYGPYGRLIADYRRAWENISITDVNPDYNKKFMMVDLSLKYKLQVAKKDLIITGFGRVNAVSDKMNPSHLFSKGAFVRQYFEEFMAFYHIHPKVTLVGLVNYEQMYGNERTEMADAQGELILGGGDDQNLPMFRQDGKAISQFGAGYGGGVDWDFASRASISFRYRWYSHEDKNFTKDKFAGQEMTTEFKLFF